MVCIKAAREIICLSSKIDLLGCHQVPNLFETWNLTQGLFPKHEDYSWSVLGRCVRSQLSTTFLSHSDQKPEVPDIPRDITPETVVV